MTAVEALGWAFVFFVTVCGVGLAAGIAVLVIGAIRGKL